MSDYVTQMRKLIGSMPLLQCGSAVIIIGQDGRILLHHRTDNDTWGLPGGSMELGERLEDCAIRETREEVGLICHSLEFFGVYSGPEFYYRYANGDEAHNVTVAYFCRDFSGAIRVDPTEGKDCPPQKRCPDAWPAPDQPGGIWPAVCYSRSVPKLI